MMPTLCEKLQFNDEKNVLIQGLPSTIEKQFCKISFAKNITPLLKTKKVDFALIFAVNECQLNNILDEVLPALSATAKLWIAYPQKTSKIASDLNRDCNWSKIMSSGFETVREVSLDHVWTALRFKKMERMAEPATMATITTAYFGGSDKDGGSAFPSEDFARELNRSRVAADFFNSLPSTNKKEYVSWIVSARKKETRHKRIEMSVDRLLAGKKHPSEK